MGHATIIRKNPLIIRHWLVHSYECAMFQVWDDLLDAEELTLTYTLQNVL